jgi:heat shock protein HslJ
MTLLCLAIVTLLSPLFAPFATQGALVPDIAPHVWALVSFTPEHGEAVEVRSSERYTAQFLPDGKATFRLDCNRGQADFTATDGNLELTNLATTDALCPASSHGAVFTAMTMSAERYRFDDTGNLILRGPQGALLFRPVLAGVTWQWQGISDSSGVVFVTPPVPERYTLEFLPDGALAIHADCNRASARVRTNGSAMAIRLTGETQMTCRPDSLGALYLFGLRSVEHWYLFNGVLSLSLPDGAGMMTFGPVPGTAAIPTGVD